MKPRIALKIDADTYRGVEDGAARLADYLHSQKIPASFFVSLGPDNSGRAALRVFRQRGFLRKMRRTGALSLYGWRTALSGTLLPARPIGTSFRDQLRRWRDGGFEVSPHGYDHIRWHDEAATWDLARATEELTKTVAVYQQIFGEGPQSFAAPGWQAGWGTWRAMEKMNLLYHSDTRGESPYYPVKKPSSPAVASRPVSIGSEAILLERTGGMVGGGSMVRQTSGGDDNIERFKTLEIPTTLPTWDEMLAWDGIHRQNLVEETWKLLKKDQLNVWTVHAEFEGAVYFPQFHELVERAVREEMEWVFLPQLARQLLEKPPRQVPYDGIEQGTRPGRAGSVTCQLKPKV